MWGKEVVESLLYDTIIYFASESAAVHKFMVCVQAVNKRSGVNERF